MTLLEHIELALLELQKGYESQAQQTLSTIIEEIKKGTFDILCSNCNCVIEEDKT